MFKTVNGLAAGYYNGYLVSSAYEIIYYRDYLAKQAGEQAWHYK